MKEAKGLGTMAVFLVGLFVLMYVLNAWMPMYRDDYIAAVIWKTGDHLQSVQDVFLSLDRYYFMHGGRLVSFFVQFFFLLYGKFWFNIFNAAIFTAMMVCMYFHVVRSLRLKDGLPLLAALTAFSWLCISHFGEIAIWMCGSAVYLWTGFFTALFLLPYNLQLTGNYQFSSAKLALPMLLGGMIAACSVENLTVTTTLLVWGCSIYCWRKGTRPFWMWAGSVGSLVGTAFCLLAPGNFVRYVSDQDRALLFHFANQISANLEMLLYMLPVLLVLVLAWRILLLDLAHREGIKVSQTFTEGKHQVMLGVIVCFAVSFFCGGILANGLEQLIVWGILTPLGLTDEITLSHFANTMSGFEEVVIYWLGVSYVYLQAIRVLGLSKRNLRPLRAQLGWKKVWQAYPELHYAAALIALAFLNNLFVLGAPSFPGRALFGSSVMLVMAAGVVLHIPVVREKLLYSDAGRAFRRGGVAITLFIMVATLAVLHAIWQEDAVRVSYIRAAAERQELVVTVPPSKIPEKQRVLRHIAYDDFDTGMTREEICAYFGINDIRLDPSMKL